MPNCNEDVNFSKKLICFNALNQDIRKRIVKIILHVVIVRRITTQLFAIKRKIEIVITMEFSEIQVSYHKEIIKLVKLTLIQHEDGERLENLHESNVEELFWCLVEANTSIILQTTNSIATDNYENKISTVEILLDSGSQ